MIFRSLLALFVLVSFVSSETLEQEYYGINVPAGENTALPPGNTQALRMRGVGVQVYECAQTQTDNFEWVLQEPRASLYFYNGNKVNTNRKPDGVHYFANPGTGATAGSGAGWDIGRNCREDTLTCSIYTGRWRGTAPVSDPQEGAIAWLLVEKDEDNMMPSYPASDLATYNRLWNYNYMQRLDTVAGVPLDSCNSSSVGTINEAAYECDYVLAFQSIAYLSAGVANLPCGCFQSLPWEASGVQKYECVDNQWLLSEPIASLTAYSTKLPYTPIDAANGGNVGFHYFANPGMGTPGSGAGWDVGVDCTQTACTFINGIWRGTSPQAQMLNDTNNIPMLLVDRDFDNTPDDDTDNALAEYRYMQRLNLVGGTAPDVSECDVPGEFFESPYTADYVLALCIEGYVPASSASSLGVSLAIVLFVISLSLW